MTRRIKAIDEADLQEVLGLPDDFGSLEQDSAQMRSEMNKLQEEMLSMSNKQGEISNHVGNAEQVLLDLSKQLSAMSSVLQTLVKATSPNPQDGKPSSSNQVPKSPTL